VPCSRAWTRTATAHSGISEAPRHESTTPDQAIAARYLERQGRFARPYEFRVVTESPVFERGDVNRPGENVSRGFLSVLTHKPPPEIPAGSSGRRELAEWMLTDSNPLAARVMVNRIWQWLFGLGVVSTPDNFGTTGKPPSNQALLDTLRARARPRRSSTASTTRRRQTSAESACSPAGSRKPACAL
jgi:hypothetical protein